MTMQQTRRIVITASVAETCDGLLRLIVDAQRFGFTVADVRATAQTDASASIRITVLTDSSIGCDMLESRLSRHPVVQGLRAVELDPDGAGWCPSELDDRNQARIEEARP